MADCFGSFVTGVMRVAFLIGCILSVLAHILIIVLVVAFDNHYGLGLPESIINYRVYMHVYFTLALSLNGCYCFWSKDERSYKIFYILALVHAAILIFVVCVTFGTSATDEKNADFKDKMTKYLPNYDWNHNANSTAQVEEATEAWDTLQLFACCGLDGPDDWNSVRPAWAKTTDLPISCCLGGKLGSSKVCTSDDIIFKKGCMSQVIELDKEVRICYWGFICLHLAFAMVAFLLGHLSSRDSVQNFASQRFPMGGSNF